MNYYKMEQHIHSCLLLMNKFNLNISIFNINKLGSCHMTKLIYETKF